jgi:glycosyltransferase involved in cell wall biosynthesis
MGILGVSVVKNEEDILVEGYTRFLDWCDYMAVVDNGSTDGTVDILHQLQAEHPGKFFFIGSRIEPFRDSLRRYPYEFLKTKAKRGDWWCRLDPDEQYVDNPREFLQSIPFYCSVVASLHIQYYFTHEDFRNWEKEESESAHLSISQRRRYYNVDGFSEQRFWRHFPGQKWKPDASFPSHIGSIASKHIRIKHFKYRTPGQIQKRVESHGQAYEDGHHNWALDKVGSWTDKLADERELVRDDFSGNYVYPDNLDFLLRDSMARSVIKTLMYLLSAYIFTGRPRNKQEPAP